MHILHSSSIKSKGIRKGLIIDSNLMVNSIKDGIKVVSNDLGFQIKKSLLMYQVIMLSLCMLLIK